MTRFRGVLVLIAALLLVHEVQAQRENPLSRDEVAVIKKKLVNVLEALGQPAGGYAIEHENFNLPTEAYKNTESSLFQPVSASADRTYGTQKQAEKQNEDLSKEYQKKFAEAQAKGDYQAMAKLSQEMQKKSGEAQLKAVEGKKEPVTVTVNLNYSAGATIDPDAVLFERSGVIALKTKDQSSTDKERVYIYFDPVLLKDTKQLSRVDLRSPEKGVAKRITVLHVTIELYGPAGEIEPLAKKVDVSKVLAQIDAAK